RAIELGTDEARVWKERGAAYASQNRLPEALEDFTSAISRQPEDEDLHFQRAHVQARLQDFDGALAGYTRALELRATGAAHNNRGNIYLQRGDFQAAIADFDSAIRLDPNDYYPRWGRGRAYTRQGEHAKALADYTAALRLNPKAAALYVDR